MASIEVRAEVGTTQHPFAVVDAANEKWNEDPGVQGAATDLSAAAKTIEQITEGMQQLSGSLSGADPLVGIGGGIKDAFSSVLPPDPSITSLTTVAATEALDSVQYKAKTQAKIASDKLAKARRGLTKDFQGQPDVSASRSSINSPREQQDATVKIGSFHYKSRSGRNVTAEAAFWPPGKELNMMKITEIMQKTWKMGQPNLVVYIDAGTAHPTVLSTPLLRELPQFKEWVKTAALQKQLFESRTGSADAGGSDADASTATVIDNLLFNKLVLIFAAILDACEKTNNYILVDRTAGSSATAELLIEKALQCTESQPTILVVENKLRLEEFRSDESRIQLEQIAEIEANTVLHGTDVNIRRVELTPLYSPDDFDDEDKLGGIDYSDLPLPKHPDPGHIVEKGVEVSMMETSTKIRMNPKRLWSYHYTQYMFSSGTHYIFLEDEDQMFPAGQLGPVGAVFAHGGTMSYKRMRMWLQSGRPTVMLFNTGGVTQAFASLHSAVVKRNVADVGNALAQIQTVSQENWARNFGVSEVVMLQELRKRAPVLVRKAIVSVDILRDSPEDVLHVVTGCFAAASGNLPELGLRSAESDVVMRAWSMHMILWSSAQVQRRNADFYFLISVILLFITAILAVARVEVEVRDFADDEARSHFDRIARLALVILPILSTVVATVIQRKRSLDKWGQLYANSVRIVAEIYKYRARALDYDPGCALENQAQGETSDDASPGKSQRRTPRMHFVNVVQQIFTSAMDSDMSADALRLGATEYGSRRAGPVDGESLQKHVRKALLHTDMGPSKPADAARAREGVPNPSDVHALTLVETTDIFSAVEEDDLKTLISVETYIEKRLKPLLRHYCKWTPRLTRRLSFMETLSIGVNSLTVILAVPGNLSHWVILTVSIKALIMNIIQHYADRTQIGALNNAIRDLQNLMTWWDSLSVIERRTRAAKNYAVAIVEQCMLNVSLALTMEVSNTVNVADAREATDRDEGNGGRKAAAGANGAGGAGGK